MKFIEVIPMIGVAEIEASLAFYRDVLGFTVASEYRPEGKLCWASLNRDGVGLMLSGDVERPSLETRRPANAHVILYYYVDDVDALHAEVLKRGGSASLPCVTFYGMKEFTVEDPDGYQICFGEDVCEDGGGEPAGR